MDVMSDFPKISGSMSAHEGVSCDACGKSNFRSKRYKCLICYDYDLCSTCYEQSEISSHHTAEHPMQCINNKCFLINTNIFVLRYINTSRF